ncbi:MAG: DUF3078 domain-containing protein, partial [Bacteroidales bacterium]|nr:DUF3078 domain-containing protein [Candidatus Colimorpha onthohippi]
MRFRCLYFIVVVMLLSQPLFAADDDSSAVRKKILPGDWTFVSTPALTVNEKLYNNWSAAGNSTLVFVFGFNGTYKYTHQQFVWDNVHDFSLGVDRQDLDGNQSLESVRKNEDKIDLTSTISKRLRSAWNINFSVNFKSQFLEGKNYATSGNSEYTLVSKFMAPGYLTTSIGFEYKESDWNVSMSFLSGKTTFVTSQEVIDAGQLYGVDTTGGRR